MISYLVHVEKQRPYRVGHFLCLTPVNVNSYSPISIPPGVGGVTFDQCIISSYIKTLLLVLEQS